MKRVLLLMVISALLVTLGFAQTPDTASNTDPANVKGCLGGSDGNYTITENGTRQVFKITTSSVDLKLQVGHDVKLTGHKTSGAASSDAAGNSLVVTDLSMISEHCAAAVAATVGAVVPYSQTVIEPTSATPSPSVPASTPAAEAAAPAAMVSPSPAPATPAAEAVVQTAAVSPSPAVPTAPAVDPAAPATTVSPSAAPASTPPVEAAAPAATASPVAAQVSTPPVEATAPAATVSPSAAISAPSEKATHSARRPAAPRKLSATVDTAAAAPAATVSPTAADAVTTVSPSPEVSPAGADAASASPSATAVTPDAAAAPPLTHRAGSLTLLISFVVLVIVLGTLIPFIGRWRKRKMLEQTGAPNLSFTNDVSTNDASMNDASPTEVGTDEANSDQHKPEPSKVA